MAINRSLAVMGACLLAGAGVWAQGRNIGPEWQVASADPQRTSWQRSDPNISVENLSKPGFEFQWKTKLPAPMMSEGVTVNGVGLFWPVSLMAGSTNSMSLIDNDTGNVQWTREFGLSRGTPAAGCSGPIAAAARPVALVPPAPAPPRAGGGGRGGVGYRGMVGAPGEGVPAELSQRGGGRAAAPPPAAPAAPPPAEQGRGREGAAPGRGGGGGGGLGRLPGPAYMIADDGSLHTMGWLSGKDVQKPAPFLPANARYSDPIVVENMLYTSTRAGCGTAPAAVWAVDVSNEANKPVVSWRSNGGSPIGAIALATNGTVIASIGPGQAASPAGASAQAGYANAVVALDQKTLTLKDWFTAPGIEIASAPVILQHGGKDVVAVAAKDGRVLLLDAASLGGANHATPLHVSQSIPSASAFATWQDQDGTRWLLVPSTSTVVALKVVDEGGKPTLQAGWTSRALVAPVTPIIVNDVVFAASSGQPRGRAVLYALDGKTGKELWNSGTEMTSFMPGRTMWGANSQVHVGTADGTVYQFGFLLERR
jgi:hypothetical protein